MASQTEFASGLIDKRIEERGGPGRTLGSIRALVKAVDPEIVEEWKWRGTPVSSHAGFVCTADTHKNLVEMTFAKRRHTPAAMGMSGARSTFANLTTSTTLC